MVGVERVRVVLHVNSHSPSRCDYHCPMILANRDLLNVWGGGCYIICANRAGKCARSLFNCISVTDGIKINEQIKSIGIGPLYLQTEFEAI